LDHEDLCIFDSRTSHCCKSVQVTDSSMPETSEVYGFPYTADRASICSAYECMRAMCSLLIRFANVSLGHVPVLSRTFIPFTFIILEATKKGMGASLAGYLVSILNSANVFGRVLPTTCNDGCLIWFVERSTPFRICFLIGFKNLTCPRNDR
jgi:hypothetical protein